jgi:hypothetical protein
MALQEVYGGPNTSGAEFSASPKPVPDADKVLHPNGVQANPGDFSLALKELKARRPSTSTVPSPRPPRLVESSPPRQPTEKTPVKKQVVYERTPIHDAVAEALSRTPPDWLTLTRRLATQSNITDPLESQGRLAELYVYDVIHGVATSGPYRKKIDMQSLNNHDTPRYSFRKQDNAGIRIWDKKKKREREIDVFFLARGGYMMPSVVEVKTYGELSRDRLEEFLDPDRLEQLVEPIYDAFGKRPAMMLVATASSFNPNSRNLRRFRDNGGYTVTMQPSHEDFTYYTQHTLGSSGGRIDLLQGRLSARGR